MLRAKINCLRGEGGSDGAEAQIFLRSYIIEKNNVKKISHHSSSIASVTAFVA